MRLMTWNIQWGRGVGPDGPRTVRLEETISRIRYWSPDVICLQEVCVNFPANTDGRDEDQLALLQIAFPDYQSVFAPTTDWYVPGKVQRFGNMVLSRFPLLCSRVHLLPSPRDAGAAGISGARSAAEVWIDTPIGLYRIVSTHLEYGSFVQRRAQVEYVAGLQQGPTLQIALATADERAHRRVDMFDRRTPVSAVPHACASLIVGDFNSPPGGVEFNALGDAGYRDLWQKVHGHRPHVATLSVHHRARPEFHPICYDFIFGDGQSVDAISDIVVDCEATESDHQPLVATFSESDRKTGAR
ncbi:MAG: endonuclease/exonuclease/phosphatase family protein [Burkholderiales bacterium]|nr:endonuclease/exonuclease/phosphatase family protein [Burkholderiales bacterium]